MVNKSLETSKSCHIVLLPYPGRGHINPMLSFCKLLISSSKNINIHYTIIVTEEWLSLLGPFDKQDKISYATIPNVLPSEKDRWLDLPGFIEAVSTKMEEPVEQVLDLLAVRPTVIIADVTLSWVFDIGTRRNIPIACFFPASASFFSAVCHHELLVNNQHYPIDLLGERAEERVDYIPGIGSVRLIDLPDFFHSYKESTLVKMNKIFSGSSKAQYIILRTLNELEGQAIDALKLIFPTPIYPIGPAIMLPELSHQYNGNDHSEPYYIHWLNSQPESSVLYVSLGSFLSTTRVQLEELAAGLCDSGVPFLWPAREDTEFLQDICGETGKIIQWCDQMRVLQQNSIGGFLTHCGWNSTLESALSGVPVLTFPLAVDQALNSKMMVEDWKIGWRLKDKVEKNVIIKRKMVAETVKKFMDLDSHERKELTTQCKDFQKMLLAAVAEDASSERNIHKFLLDVSQTSI